MLEDVWQLKEVFSQITIKPHSIVNLGTFIGSCRQSKYFSQSLSLSSQFKEIKFAMMVVRFSISTNKTLIFTGSVCVMKKFEAPGL